MQVGLCVQGKVLDVAPSWTTGHVVGGGLMNASWIAGLEPVWKRAAARVARSSTGNRRYCGRHDDVGDIMKDREKGRQFLHQSGAGTETEV